MILDTINIDPDDENAPSLQAVSHLTMMLAFPLHLFHFDFVLQALDGDFLNSVKRHIVKAKDEDLKHLASEEIEQMKNALIAI